MTAQIDATLSPSLAEPRYAERRRSPFVFLSWNAHGRLTRTLDRSSTHALTIFGQGVTALIQNSLQCAVLVCYSK